MTEQFKSLYVDMIFGRTVNVDDFLIAIGAKKSNTVYHIAEVKSVIDKGRIKRHYLSVLKSDLLTAIRRDKDQNVIPFYWYKRNSKKKVDNFR